MSGNGSVWVRCTGCGHLIYSNRFARDLRVCHECGVHAPLSAIQRVEQLLDPGWGDIDHAQPAGDPLGFADRMPYPQRLAEAREATGLNDAAIQVRGRIGGHPVVVVVMDFRFLGGSLGTSVGDLVVRAAETALAERTPLLMVTASGGARMQEGALALMQMARTSQALVALDEAGVLTVSLITDPTFGGVAASFATQADVILAEPGARMGFAGPRVIEQTLGTGLPEGFQRAPYLLEHGLIDDVVPRRRLRAVLSRLLTLGRPGTVVAMDPTPVITDPAALAEADPMRPVRAARDPGRPTTLDYAYQLCDSFKELHGDRMSADCPAVVAGIGRLAGGAVVLIGHQKGHDASELTSRNFGMATPAGYRKAARLMLLAQKLGLPVVTLIDTPGAYPGVEAEAQGQMLAIAANLRLMCSLRVPIVAVVTGEGGSGGALALGVADRVFILEHGVYSVISPEGCASILWRTPSATGQAAAALRLVPADLLRFGVVDGVIPEPPGGAHVNHPDVADAVRAAVTTCLAELATVPPDDLVRTRRRRFAGFGSQAYVEGARS
ncbi:acetyl-CoA carboxylase carboxyl transferase subunit beta [Kibdelosporangium banguiense]|uniref:Multifunctional fusion protein n=1 Tax=Kibdelosporangium banguiense TaxID=1365924 RepID=A0ABS4TFF0_9PSEU|nr:acetyl-CoA carboxylase carboxyltransferase subunit alpha/beta [Kibdelosporangium banguiense]MBP2323147.1 acetyl-CoA carboxylase carboxyl transferase subunit beta [Kibdelosporangium banguiense]